MCTYIDTDIDIYTYNVYIYTFVHIICIYVYICIFVFVWCCSVLTPLFFVFRVCIYSAFINVCCKSYWLVLINALNRSQAQTRWHTTHADGCTYICTYVLTHVSHANKCTHS